MPNSYALLMYADPDHTRAMTDDDLAVVARKHAALRDELGASDELRGGAGLLLPDETVVVRPGATHQGPLMDATEHLTAYYEVECATPERAQEIAAHLLDDHVTAVEVRGIHDTA
ncbi:MAG TPA: hypothetical protein VNO82_00870 [Solirubrobacteraceae bacterium]|nr:hypothetical protein [Solirubrobacteraceae bacterium]